MTQMETTLGARPSLTARYEIDEANSRIGFAARYAMVTTVRGEFTEFHGHAELDGENPARSSVSVTLYTASLNTGQNQRDDHLRSPDFLDVESYPEIVFHSTDVTPLADDTYRLSGDLTICGVTRSVAIDLVLTGTSTDHVEHELVGFEGSADIKRSDFGLTWNAVLETGGVLVGDEISLHFDVALIKVQAVAA